MCRTKSTVHKLYHIFNYFHKEFEYRNILWLEKSRHPGNWLPSLRGQKRRKEKKNDVKLQISTQNKRKKIIKTSCVIFWLPSFFEKNKLQGVH